MCVRVCVCLSVWETLLVVLILVLPALPCTVRYQWEGGIACVWRSNKRLSKQMASKDKGKPLELTGQRQEEVRPFVASVSVPAAKKVKRPNK